jgi:1,5-anhydro-D-fructose reductase (1,5-anhydro-D-mannitol-forming)
LLPRRMQSWRLRPNGGGVILHGSSHSLDLLRFLLQDEVAELAAVSGQRLLGELVEEDVLTRVRMARSGALFHLHDSFIVPHNRSSIEIYGDIGTLIAYHCLPEEPAGELLLLRNQQLTPLPISAIDPYWQVVYAFQQAVRNNGQPLASGQDGLRSLQLAQAVQESVQKGSTVALPHQRQ